MCPKRDHSVDRSFSLCLYEQRDKPLDLPPTAKMHDIAKVAAAISPGRRFDASRVAMFGEQCDRKFRRLAIRKIELFVHVDFDSQPFRYDAAITGRHCGTAGGFGERVVSYDRVTGDGAAGIAPAMQDQSKNTALSGGVFLTLCPLIGFFVGRSMGETSAGIIAGIGAGLVLVLLVWLLRR